ncbi:hypothetical protein MMC15_004791 [Xylographa vitiligo]|nr:hypothetical protein [Xylographa vitiligo]
MYGGAFCTIDGAATEADDVPLLVTKEPARLEDELTSDPDELRELLVLEELVGVKDEVDPETLEVLLVIKELTELKDELDPDTETSRKEPLELVELAVVEGKIDPEALKVLLVIEVIAELRDKLDPEKVEDTVVLGDAPGPKLLDKLFVLEGIVELEDELETDPEEIEELAALVELPRLDNVLDPEALEVLKIEDVKEVVFDGEDETEVVDDVILGVADTLAELVEGLELGMMLELGQLHLKKTPQTTLLPLLQPMLQAP